jgi:FemAB-related protein (PEP-CTERM system-associated)
MVSACGPGDEPRWDAYVTAHCGASRYHLSAWRRVIETTFGHQTHYLLSSANGVVNGVLPLARVRSFLFGDFLVSLPYVNYGGACADDSSIAVALETAAVDLARTLGVQHLELRSERALETTLDVRISKVSMRLALPATSEALWTALGSKLRNQIKRPERENVTVRIGRQDELDAFYRVFSINMRDLGTPVYPKKLFASVLRELPDTTTIVSVYRGAEPVASAFLVGFRDAIEVPWASSLRAHNAIGANVFLYWQLLKFACDHGYATFDFGRSSPGSGPFKFKQQWGAQPVQLHWQHWVPPGRQLPQVNPQNPRYQMAVRMWQKLPVPVTRLIGPAIVRSIP